MFIAKQIHYLRKLDNWFSTAQGKHVSCAFLEQLEKVKTIARGEKLIQLGNCDKNPWLPILPFRQKWIVAPYRKNKTIHLISSLQQLPVTRESIDCVLVPLTMDAFPGPKNPLDEIDRVLKSMGYVIFWGVNPCSLWGLWLRFSHQSYFNSIQSWPKSPLYIKQLLQKRGYEPCFFSTFYYLPPFHSEKWIAPWEIMNIIGKIVAPIPAGFYCLIMQKREENWWQPISLPVARRSFSC